MKIKIFFVVLLFSIFLSKAEDNLTTKDKVDSLKESIKYPKYNLGDTVYIALIKNEEIGTNTATRKDLITLKVKVVDMRLYNDIGGKDFSHGVFLNSQRQDNAFPLKWEYQYIDTKIPNPKYKDLSDFKSEDSFYKTKQEAVEGLVQFLKENGNKIIR